MLGVAEPLLRDYAPEKQNRFEGGPDGATITAANSASPAGDAFTQIAGTTTYAAAIAHGSFSGQLAVPASAAAVYVGWGGLGSILYETYGRVYLYLTAYPSVVAQLARIQDEAGVMGASIRLTATGTIRAFNAAGTGLGVASAALPLNQWVRIEYRYLPGTAAGEIEVRAWWTDPQSTGTPDYTSNNTGAALGANLDAVRFGQGTSATQTVAWNPYIDDLAAAHRYTWLGPSTTTGPTIYSWGISDTGATISDGAPPIVAAPSLGDGGVQPRYAPYTGKQNTFEGGPNANAITVGNSGGASGDALDSVNVGALAMVYGALGMHGGQGLLIPLGAGTAYVSYTVTNTTDGWFRVYYRSPDAGWPAGGSIPIELALAGAVPLSVSVDNTGIVKLQVSGHPVQATGTVNLSANHWYRFEGHHSSTNQFVVSYYDGDSTTPLETLTTAAFGATSIDQIRLQQAGWFDDFNADATSAPGPSVYSSPDSLQRPVAHPGISDTGATVSDSLATIRSRGLSDSAFTVGTLDQDAFTRTGGDLAGTTADSGQTYVAPTDFTDTGFTWSTDGSRAVALPSIANTFQARTLSQVTDGDFYLDVQMGAAAVGGSQEAGIIVRHADGTHFLRAVVRQTTTNVVTLRFLTGKAGNIGGNFTLTGGDPVANAYRIHLNVSGYTLNANAWVVGGSEPGGWQLTTTLATTDPQVGDAGLWVEVFGVTSFPNFYFDNLQFNYSGSVSDYVRIGSGNVSRAVSDTGASISDSLQRAIARPSIADTGATISDGAPQRVVARPIADTGATVSDGAPSRSATRGVADTGSTVSDALRRLIARPGIADTGATITDSLQRAVARPGVADTGSSIADSLTRITARPGIADTGSTITDALQRLIARPGIADTGSSITDTVSRTSIRSASDTGATITDSLVSLRGRAIADTGSTLSDSVARINPRQVADTATTITDSLRRLIGRAFADTGSTVSDSLGARLLSRGVADTGSSISDALQRIVARTLADTGATITDSAARAAPRQVADTGATISDSAPLRLLAHPIADTGATVSDGAPSRILARGVADTGVSQSDALGRTSYRSASDTGATITDALARTIGRIVADTGSAVSDALQRAIARPSITDTGSTVSDSASAGAQTYLRTVSDYGIGGPIGSDTFTRTVAATTTASWGTTDSGQSWSTVTTGASMTYGVNGSQATNVTVAANTNRRGQTIPASGISQEILAQFSQDALPVGGSYAHIAYLRYLDSNNAYTAEGFVTPTGNLQYRVRKFIASSGTIIVAVTTVATFAAGDKFWVRGRIEGNAIFVRVWKDGITEPSSWSAIVLDSDLASGSAVGIGGQGTSGQTSGTNQTLDNFSAILVQGDTVASLRARPGISDTGASIGDSLVRPGTRQIADTGSTVSDSLSRQIGRPSIADLGTTISDTAATLRARPIADTGAAVSDALGARQISRGIAATGTTISDALATIRARAIADVGVALSDAVLRSGAPTTRTIADYAFTQLYPSLTLYPSSTLYPGGGMSDVVTSSIRYTRPLSDTGAAVSDSISRGIRLAFAVADAGATITDSLGGGARPGRPITDQGVSASYTDTFSQTDPNDLPYPWIGGFFAGGGGWQISEQAGRGQAIPTIAGQNQARTLPDSHGDGDWYADFQFSTAAAGNEQDTGIILRGIDTNNYVVVYLLQVKAGGIHLHIDSRHGGSTISFGFATLSGVDPIGGPVTVHVRASGLTIQANAYTAGTAEPAGWQISATLSSADPVIGVSGWRVNTNGSNTNLATQYVDNFSVSGPGIVDQVSSNRQPHVATDTGATITDSIARAKGPVRSASDTGATISDSLRRAIARLIADVGSTILDGAGIAKLRTVTPDTGATISDSVSRALTRLRTVSDTGSTISDALTLRFAYQRGIADVGTAAGDSVHRNTNVFYISDDGVAFGDAITRLVRLSLAIADTGVTITDGALRGFQRLISDTATSISDALHIAVARRGLSDVGSTILDSLGRAYRVGLADAGSTITDSLARALRRSIADAGSVIADSLAKIGSAHLGISDAGATVTDTVSRLRQVSRVISDTGSMVADALGRQLRRFLADAGASITDLLGGTLRLAGVADQGATITDQLASRRSRFLADAGASIGDLLGRALQRGIADTGASLSDALSRAIVRRIADTATTISDSISFRAYARRVTDLGATITDSARVASARLVSDTGATILDSLGRLARRLITDLGATISDTLRAAQGRRVADTGATLGDTVRRPQVALQVADAGSVQSDALRRQLYYRLADIGAVLGDSLATDLLYRLITDVGLTESDALRRYRPAAPIDVGAIIADALRRQLAYQLADAGVVFADSLGVHRVLSRQLFDVGAYIIDLIVRYRLPGGPLSSSPTDSPLSSTPRLGTLRSDTPSGDLASDPNLGQLRSQEDA